MKMFKYFNLFLFLIIYPVLIFGFSKQLADFEEAVSLSSEEEDNSTEWHGRWFPERLKESDTLVKHLSKPTDFEYLEDEPWITKGSSSCDNGKDNLDVDWPKTANNYTCVIMWKQFYWPDPDLAPIIYRSYIPPAYKAGHVCMNETIKYNSDLPTFGPHRAVWPRYGEYKFIPKERWIHSLEVIIQYFFNAVPHMFLKHGAVVMLYHPCAHPFIVNQVKTILRSCLRRHIISPYLALTQERPIALLTWGWLLLLPDVYEEEIVKFIKMHALHGPENVYQDGKYDYKLLKPAGTVTKPDDSGGVCPKYK